MSAFILVMTHLPDQPSAERLARALVENNLAACVNIQAPCRSVYRWEGKVESAEEIPLLIKTRQERYEEIQALIRTQHPYTLPDIIMLPIQGGLPAYLDWIQTETAKEGPWAVC